MRCNFGAQQVTRWRCAREWSDAHTDTHRLAASSRRDVPKAQHTGVIQPHTERMGKCLICLRHVNVSERDSAYDNCWLRMCRNGTQKCRSTQSCLLHCTAHQNCADAVVKYVGCTCTRVEYSIRFFSHFRTMHDTTAMWQLWFALSLCRLCQRWRVDLSRGWQSINFSYSTKPTESPSKSDLFISKHKR